MLDADLVREGIIFEVLDETGVGAPLLSLAESCMSDTGGPSAEILEALDEELRTEVEENVEYAIYMLFHARTAEYFESLPRACLYRTGNLLQLVKRGMSVDAAICEMDVMDDADTTMGESSGDEMDDPNATPEEYTGDEDAGNQGEGGAPHCRCHMCKTWPTLESRFQQWGRQSSGVQRTIANMVGRASNQE